jgi:ureidoglycolate dehydrogenase (NAD+)
MTGGGGGDIRVRGEALAAFARALFEAAGVPAHDAAAVAGVLLWANLRGVDSHGVLRVPRYLRWLKDGVVNPRPDLRVVRETPAALVIDGDRCFGPVGLRFAMTRAMEKAGEAGIGWAMLRRSTHAGAIGYYPLMAARAGMAGLCIGGSIPNMAWHGARAAGVATSPVAIAVPGRDHPPLMLDMATAVAAIGKLLYYRDAGLPLPAGWALDAAGAPTTDPAAAAIPMPLGGPKGAGLALMFECLTSLMAGAPLLEPRLAGRTRGHAQAGLAVAIDIARFTDPDDYRRNVDALVAAIKALPRAGGVDEILVPGEHGDAIARRRTETGIPLPAGTWDRLAGAAAELGVALPERL